jgi:protease IV
MRDFLKTVFASLTGTIIFFAAILGFFVLLLISLTSGGGPSEPKVEEKAVLVIDLSTTISDTAPPADLRETGLDKLIGGGSRSIPLSVVLDCIDKAAKDKRIVGIYMHGNLGTDNYGSGFAALKEVREALERFKTTKKPIYAYNEAYSERDYYLASVADTCYLNPFGAIEMNGLASEMMFLGDAFKKYGIGVQVTRVGKYKSAVEPYLLNKMSGENREQTEKLINDLWDEYMADIARSRKISVDDIKKVVNEKALLSGDDAIATKFADKVVYFDQVLGDLKKLTGKKDTDTTFRQVNLVSYAKVSRRSLGLERESKNIIAVVYAEGNIVDGTGTEDQVGGDRLARQLRDLRQDPDVKAIVLRVNSPGGSALASELIQRELVLTRQAKKTVVVSMGTVAASGGYWIATASDKIFAEPNTITGSIGVFGILPNVQKLANDYGVTWDTAKTGKYADLGTLSRPKTDEEMALIQRTVDRIYDQFLIRVSEARKMPKDKVAEIAQGRVWSGSEAKKLGLVDEIGGMEAAIKAAADIAKLGADWKFSEYPKRRSFNEKLAELFSDDGEPGRLVRTPLDRELQKVREDLSAIGAFNDPTFVYARMPFNLRIN